MTQKLRQKQNSENTTMAKLKPVESMVWAMSPDIFEMQVCGIWLNQYGMTPQNKSCMSERYLILLSELQILNDH